MCQMPILRPHIVQYRERAFHACRVSMASKTSRANKSRLPIETLHFENEVSDYRQIGEHVVGAEKFAEGLHHVGDAAAALNDFFVDGGGKLVPFPRVLKGFELRGSAGAVLFGEEHVVVLIALEGRIEIDEVDGFVPDIAAENVEVVAVVKMVHSRG